jgi:transketolase C-terminal domain/subunit
MIRNYIDHENISVNIVGGGRDKDYGYLGFSHWADDDKKIMQSFKNIRKMHPIDSDQLQINFNSIINDPCPTYINLKK